MFYSVDRIVDRIVYLDADGMTVCASLDKFMGEIHETDLVTWQDGFFYPVKEETEKVQKELHTLAHNVAKNGGEDKE